MPKSTREWARRKMEMAAGCTDKAVDHLIEMVQPYKQDFPAFATNVEQIAEQLIALKLLITELRTTL